MTLTQYIDGALTRTETAFAKQLGISKSMLSRIKNGSRKPNVVVAKKIERATRGAVKAAVLLGLEKK